MIIASDATTREHEFFEGYAFVGADYVAGAAGYVQFLARGGEKITPGHDGCYVVGSHAGGSLSVGADCRGMARLFFYRSGSKWILGNSLSEVADWAHQTGLRLTPRSVELRLMGIRTAFSSQLTSESSIFEEITLLRVGVTAVISGSEIRFQEPDPIPPTDRDSALRDYILAWRNRLATLVNDPRVKLPSDLSGGLDSRVMSAFLIEHGGVNTSEARFKISSQTKWEADFAAASRIADEFGLTLNGPAPRTAAPASGLAALDRWRKHSLGVYLPVYLTPREFDPFLIQGHGAGGENHRDYYEDVDLQSRLDRYKGAAGSHHQEWSADVQATIGRASQWRSSVKPLTVHYREYRNRFHFGHRPHVRPMFTPLNSGLLDPITDRPDGGDVRQVYFDVMESLVPGLCTMPYDDEDKGPTPDNLSNLTVIRDLTAPEAGQVFAEELSPLRSGDTVDPHEMWWCLAEDALNKPAVQEIMEASSVERAKDAIAHGSAVPSGSKGVIDLSHALTVDFAVSKYTSGKRPSVD